MTLAKHYYISGRVQGVFFRDSTLRKAEEIGISGWVRNMQDGRVECFAQGTDAQLEQFETFLWQGPPAAEVSDVSIEPAEVEPTSSFEVLR